MSSEFKKDWADYIMEGAFLAAFVMWILAMIECAMGIGEMFYYFDALK